MSHKATTQVDLYDADALRAALTEMGVAFVENTQWIGYSTDQNTHVNFLIEKQNPLLDGRYHYAGIGFRECDGKLELVMDSIDAASTTFRDLVTQFKRCYTERAACNLLSKFGYRIVKQPDGTYRATATTKTVSALLRRAEAKNPQTIRVGRY